MICIAENEPKMGKPSPFDGRRKEVIESICALLKTGKPLAQICRENDQFPEPNTVRYWCDEDEELRLLVVRARSEGYDAIAEECLVIADDDRSDHGEDGYEPEHVQRSKLRVETRLKLLKCWDPKRYGDQPQSTTVNVGVSVTQVSAEELAGIANKKALAMRLLKERE